MSNEHNCPRCNAPFFYFTQINTRVFYCGSDTQIPSMACRYASHLQDRIKRLEELGSELRDCASRIGTVASGEASIIRRTQEAIEEWDNKTK